MTYDANHGLWAVHIIGMDDILPCASRRLAVRNATWGNLSAHRTIENLDKRTYPLTYQVPVRWEGSPEGHAEALADLDADPRWSDPDADVLGALAVDEFASGVHELTHVLIEEFGGPTEADVEGGAIGMAIRLLREKRAAAGDRS